MITKTQKNKKPKKDKNIEKIREYQHKKYNEYKTLEANGYELEKTKKLYSMFFNLIKGIKKAQGHDLYEMNKCYGIKI
jgi:hypothetical protein